MSNENLSVCWIAEYSGPNIYDKDPLLVCELNLTTEINTEKYKLIKNDLEKFINTRAFLAEDKEAYESLIHDQSLLVGKLISKSAQAVLNEVRGHIKVAGAKRDKNTILIWIGFHNRSITVATINLLLKVVNAILNGQNTQAMRADLEYLWQVCRRDHPDYQASILMSAADQMDIPYLNFLPEMRCWQFGWGANSLRFVESHSEEDSNIGSKIAGNKFLAKNFMQLAGAPCSKHLMINDIDSIASASKQIGFPCVLKPIDRGQAKGVTVNIKNLSDLRIAFNNARKHSQLPLMLESHVPGNVHRLLVVRGKFIAATLRNPPSVVGDGQTKLIDLVHSFNKKRLSNMTAGSYTGPAPIDKEFRMTITEQGFDELSIPANETTVKIRSIPLLGTGSENKDVTDIVHPDTVFFIESMAESLGLSISGFDFITPDISRSCLDVGSFLEFNICPSLRGHLVEDKDVRNIGAQVIGNIPKRLPTILVVSDSLSYKTYINNLNAYPGLGWRFKDATGVGAIKWKGDLRKSINALLINKKVKGLLIACSPDEILKYGLPLDKFDHSIICPDCNTNEIHTLVSNFSKRIFIDQFNSDFLTIFKEKNNEFFR